MNKHNLKVICEQEKLYEVPHMNTKLYLQMKGFSKIENLEPYVNICALWLNQNTISKIEGLDVLTKLRCLYL